MNLNNKPVADAQEYRLPEYLANSHVTADTFAAINRHFKTQGSESPVLISVADKAVIEFTSAMFVLGIDHPDIKAKIWNYADWRDAAAEKLTNSYDQDRFYRSTQLVTLRQKVLEHKQYSFVTRMNTDEDNDRVVQYTFTKLDDDADNILGIKQDITLSIEHDTITGGLNREGLLRELNQKIRNSSCRTKLTLLCFNIRNFRLINELHGNEAGDKVLQYMYTTLVYSELHPISYARYESDNFMCLINRHHLDTDVISRLCLQECKVGNQKILFRCECGIYQISDNTESAAMACSHARFSLRFIKESFSIPWIEYSPQMQADYLKLEERPTAEAESTTANETAAKADEDVTTESSPVLISRKVLEEQNARLLKSVEEAKCLRMLLEEQDIHYFEWDIKTHEDIAGDKFVKMYGLPSNVIPNMPEVAPLCLPEDLERFRNFYCRAANGEKMGSDCFRLYTPDGKGYIWYRKTFYTIFDSKGMPYKAIITMQDSQDEYRYRILRTRDRMLTQQQEIVTFIYTANNDTLSITYCTPAGRVETANMPQFLQLSNDQLTADQQIIADNLRRIISENLRSGHFDFPYPNYKTDFRAHYAMVDGEYGHLYAIIGQAEDINKTRDRLNAKEQMLRLAEIDGLTQIYNRTAGERKVSEILNAHQPGAFGILDCDYFKQVNDTFGHVAGDMLLQNIARIISDGNPHGISLRLGGDEFAFFTSDGLTQEAVQAEMESFFGDIEKLQIPGMEDYQVSVSVGIVLYDGKTDIDFDSIYRAADLLLYQSKKFPGNKMTLKKL